jgi:hypothetical protein
MLLFQKRFHAGIVDRSVRLTFRQWDKPHVRVGGRYRVHPLGVVEVEEVGRVAVRDIGEAEAKLAGFESRTELLEYLRERAPITEATQIWRIKFHHGGDGDRVELALEDKLSPEDVKSITERLKRLDAKRRWTQKTMELIAQNPKVAASQLAIKLKRDKVELKEDIRKLKRLGLTESYEVGYDLSPRGKAFFRAKKKAKPRGT